MITGANTNVRYRGILFHVQTEDSGRANPHIISHLYHGGTILGSQKTDYSEHLETPDLLGKVKALIDEQHAAMLAQLKEGAFDEVIQQRLGETAVEAGVESGPAAAGGLDAETESPFDAEPKPDTEPELESPAPPPAAGASQLDEAVEERARAVAANPPAPRDERAFGEGLGSGKPLDEVILDYLCDKARERGPGQASEG